MPNFQKLASEGVKARGLIPPFPSQTSPSMVTLRTGLYPESHGIIDNYFFDEKGNLFSYTDDPRNTAHFYTQESIWLSNQKQGSGHSSVYYWPGYYAFTEKPTYHNHHITSLGANVTTGRQAIDETFEHYERDPSLNFMVIYIDAPDIYRERMENLDKEILGYVLEKLSKRPEINLLVTSDHGHIDVAHEHIRFISDYLSDEMLGEKPYCSSTCSLRPADGYTADQILEYLAPLFETGGFRVFNRDNPYDQFPDHLHFTNHRWIPPILILAEPGWLLLDDRSDQWSKWHGLHGYDPSTCPEMQTIFYARGPAFKRAVTMEAFESVNVYPLLAHLLGVKPRPNNGSLAVFKHVLKDGNLVQEESSGNGNITNFVIGLVIVLVLVIGLYFGTQNKSSRDTFGRVKKNLLTFYFLLLEKTL
ncbi:bis(5'-adenosyl)-triphosphatase enpp4-like [Clytia hemisphaerica]